MICIPGQGNQLVQLTPFFYAPKQCLKRNAKKVKKLLKKGLTNEITFGMIIKLLANEVHTEQTNANLENDTEQEERKETDDSDE